MDIVSILKQHYEKVVLGVLVLGFIFSMIYLLQMVESAKDVTVKSLKLSGTTIYHEVLDFKDRKYQADYMLGERAQWGERKNTGELGFTAELSVPMKALRCENKECQKIMPWSVAKKRKCPFCGNELGDPQDPPDYESEIAKLDSDGDGMPDRYETKMGFNPLDPSDADTDKDNDGFSNLYEFLVKTDPTDVNNAPSAEKCLYLYRLVRKVMPIMLNGVTVMNKQDKKTWSIDLSLNGMREFKALGNELTVGKRKYRIVDVEYRTKDKQDVSVTLDTDASQVTIAPVAGGKVDMAGKVVLTVNKKAYENDYSVMIRDVRTPRKRPYRVEPNGTFAVAGEKGKKVTFQLLSVDAQKEMAEILNTETEARILLVKHARTLKNAYVKAGEQSSDDSKPKRKVRRRRRVRN